MKLKDKIRRWWLWYAHAVPCYDDRHEWSHDQTPRAISGYVYCLRCGESGYLMREL